MEEWNPKKTKTEDQLKKSFQNSEIFRKIQKSEIVNNFFENLGNIFENSHSPILEIFDEFCEDATGKFQIFAKFSRFFMPWTLIFNIFF